MARGSKEKYTEEQKRKAEHIEKSYEHKGVPKDEAEARAWAIVNKQSGGGEKSGVPGRRHRNAKKIRPRETRANAPHRLARASHVNPAHPLKRRPNSAC